MKTITMNFDEYLLDQEKSYTDGMNIVFDAITDYLKRPDVEVLQRKVATHLVETNNLLANLTNYCKCQYEDELDTVKESKFREGLNSAFQHIFRLLMSEIDPSIRFDVDMYPNAVSMQLQEVLGYLEQIRERMKNEDTEYQAADTGVARVEEGQNRSERSPDIDAGESLLNAL